MTHQGEKSVTLLLRVKHAGKWKRLPAAYGRNGRIRPGYAQVGKEQIRFDSPAYEIRLYKNRQAKYIPAGRNASDAEAERVRQERLSYARSTAIDAGLKIQDDHERKNLRKSAESYIEDCEMRHANEAASQARLVAGEFIGSCRKTFLDEITRKDLLQFHAALRARGCSPRTVANKHARLKSWLLFAGIDREIIPPAPKYDEELPTIYSRDEVSSILGAASPNMHLAINLAYKCGLRDQEITHCEFRDVDFEECVIRVRSKPRYKFKIKDSEERDVPVPKDLVVDLKRWRSSHEGQELVIPNRKGKPNRKLLRALKRLVKDAGLNCVRCEGCRSRQECEEWTLHKFRRTYITTLLRNGIDLRTVQAYAGHADLASTMRYLRPASGQEAQRKLNAVIW
jgi:integrase